MKADLPKLLQSRSWSSSYRVTV